jgi:conjugal transfer mating pair stabilization protein TraN
VISCACSRRCRCWSTTAWRRRRSQSQGQLEQGDVQAANNDGTAFAKGQKSAAEGIPDQQVNADTIPGYQAAPDSLSGLYGTDDKALGSAATGAVGNDAWNLMRGADSNRSRIDPASLADIKARGEAINANAGSTTEGLATSGQQGQCQEILTPPTQVFYEATCDVGQTVSSSEPVGAFTPMAGRCRARPARRR